MSETVKIRREVYHILSGIAREGGYSSPEEALERIILKEDGIPDDMFGIDKGRLSSYSEEDRMEDGA